MTAIVFPTSPAVNDKFSASGKEWQWDGSSWNLSALGIQGPTGPQGIQGEPGPAGTLSSTTPLMSGTAAVGTETSSSHGDHRHPSDTSRASLASPTFTGTPAAPTAAVDNNTTQVATTAYVVGQGYLKSATAASTYAPIVSPTLTGVPAAPTAAVDTNTTQVATTAYVVAQSYAKTSSPTFTTSTTTNIGALGSTVATYLTPISINSTTTNVDLLKTTLTRTATGSDWQTAQWRIQRTVDASSMGYIAFGSTNIWDVRIGSTATDIAIFAPTAITLNVATYAPTASVGTNTTQVATTAFVYQREDFLVLALSDETTALTTGTAKITFRAPYAMTLTQIPRANVNTASSSGIPTVDIKVTGTTILGAAKLTIDATEKTSTTAAIPTTLATSTIADDAEITFDVTVAGTGTKGLKVILFYRRT